MDWVSILAEIKEGTGLRSSEISRICGVSKSYIYEIEKGRSKNPNSHFIKALVEKLNISAQWLFTGEGEMFVRKEEPAGVKSEADNQLAKLDYIEWILKKKGIIPDDGAECPQLNGELFQELTEEIKELEKKNAQLKAELAFRDAEKRDGSDELNEPLSLYRGDKGWIKLPYYGFVAAGEPFNVGEAEIDEWRSVPSSLLKEKKEEYFCVGVKGDSMTDAGIVDGCEIVLQTASLPLHNRIMLIFHHDGGSGEYTVKRLKRLEDGQWIMCWENGSLRCEPLNDGAFHIHGEFISLIPAGWAYSASIHG